MVVNWIYDLPYRNSHGLGGALVGGWTITGVTQFQSGSPFTIGSNTDYAGIGTSSFQPWQVNGDPILSRGDRGFSNSGADSNYWFRVKNNDGSPIFTAPATGTFANQTRNLYYGPGFQNWNLALFKTFNVTERHHLQFRAEAFNWMNHPNWGGANGSPQFTVPPAPQGQPNGNPTSSTFGKVTTKDGRRNLQLSLKYFF